MAVETIRVAMGAPSYQIKANETGIVAVRVPGYPIINTDEYGRIWLRYNNEFETVSVTGDLSAVEGKTVVLGLTIEGVGSTIATPKGTQYALHQLQLVYRVCLMETTLHDHLWQTHMNWHFL